LYGIPVGEPSFWSQYISVLAEEGFVSQRQFNINAAVFVDNPSIVGLFCRSMQQGNITRAQQAKRLGNVFQNVEGDEQTARFFSEF
jgi:hypothetical protein